MTLVKRSSDYGMLNPKGHDGAGAPRRPPETEAGSPAEPRSFAPGAGGEKGGLAAPWPEPSLATGAASAIPDPAADPRRRALIVIPTLNEAAVIRRVVDRVLQDDGLEDPLVVVCDGGSVDETREIVREIAREDPRVRLLHNPGRLQSAGLNLAAATAAAGRAWLIRVDAHADYPRNYASSLLAEASRSGASAVVVSMETVGQGAFQRAVAAAQNSLLGAGGSPHRRAGEGRWVDHGHHALIQLAAFEALGGYDETFSHNEDAEFDLRLAQQGGRIWLTDQVRIRYYPRSSPGTLWKQYFSYGGGRARTVLKHFTPLKFRQALPLAVAPAALAAALSPLAPALILPALVWMMASVTFGVVLAACKRDPAVLMSGVAAMIMHLAWSTGFWARLLTHASQRLVGDSLAPPRQAAS